MVKENKEKIEKKEVGITAEKDDFSEWYVQLLQKAELVEYSNVSGCYILRPKSYFMWEQVQKYFDEKLKKDNVKNVYFPLLIPKSCLKKEKQHVQGFDPEVAWVTQTGDTKLSEKLAIRPTSETIFYPAYSKWIRSWRDLPLRLNQWCNVIRWEFQHPIPFLRSREFLWQEGHSAFENKEQADQEARKILDFYADIYRDIFAVPVIKGIKTEKEKFAGAEYTLTTEVFLPSGKAIQGATSHALGQNFSKAFDIKFKDKNEQEKFVYQNSWGITTRSLGIAIMMHSDNKGLIVSPKVAETQIIIIAIFNKQQEKIVLNHAKKIKNKLKKFRVEIDSRDLSPGFKFNDAELKGIPLRIEIGPRDIKKKEVTIVRRDTGKKHSMKIDIQKISKILEDMHENLYKKAKKHLEDNTIFGQTKKDLRAGISNKKLVKASWCGNRECEEMIKHETQGAKILCIVNEKPKGKCVYCGKQGKNIAYIAKSY